RRRVGGDVAVADAPIEDATDPVHLAIDVRPAHPPARALVGVVDHHALHHAQVVRTEFRGGDFTTVTGQVLEGIEVHPQLGGRALALRPAAVAVIVSSPDHEHGDELIDDDRAALGAGFLGGDAGLAVANPVAD